MSRRHCGMIRLPPLNDSPQQYLANLNELILAHGIQWIIPTCEEVFFLSWFRDRLACPCFVDEFEKLDRIHNKFSFSQMLQDPVVRVPETHFLEKAEDCEPFLKQSRDWVFKPVYSRFASETLIGPEPDQLQKFSPTPQRPWVAQRRIQGREIPTYSVAHQGDLLAHSSYFSPHRVAHASGIYFQNIVDDAIQEFVRRWVAAHQFTGQIGFDLIVDSHQQIWAIEGNPRATSGLHLFPWDDRFPNTLLPQASLGKAPVVQGDPQRPPMVAIAMLGWGLPQSLRRGHLRTFLKDFWDGKDVIWNFRDPLPALSLPLSLAHLWWVAWQRRLTLPQATTFDCEWNGEPFE